MIKTLIVDDEPLAREELIELLENYPEINVVGECGNAVEAMQALHQHQPDLIFLDIQMPKISGMELIAMIDPSRMPRIVFVTAYDQYAVEAFEKNAFDYLLKPLDEERLAKTISRVEMDISPQPINTIAAEQLNQLPCYTQQGLRVVRLADLEYVFSDPSGVHVVTQDSQTVHTHLTLKILEEKTSLIRCHRQYLVATDAIAEIQPNESGGADILTRHNHTIPVSRRYLKPLKQEFGFI